MLTSWYNIHTVSLISDSTDSELWGMWPDKVLQRCRGACPFGFKGHWERVPLWSSAGSIIKNMFFSHELIVIGRDVTYVCHYWTTLKRSNFRWGDRKDEKKNCFGVKAERWHEKKWDADGKRRNDILDLIFNTHYLIRYLLINSKLLNNISQWLKDYPLLGLS